MEFEIQFARDGTSPGLDKFMCIWIACGLGVGARRTIGAREL